MLLLAHTGIGSAVNVLRYRSVTHCAGSVEPGSSHPFNRLHKYLDSTLPQSRAILNNTGQFLLWMGPCFPAACRWFAQTLFGGTDS